MAIGGSKHFGFVKLRPDLQPVKVVTVTLEHPVGYKKLQTRIL